MFEGQPKEEVESLMRSDAEFRQLLQRHRELDKQVTDAELGVLPIDDNTLSRMKREKLYAKDRLLRMYETLDVLRAQAPALWREDLTLNTAGSPTYRLHEAERLSNDIAVGTGLPSSEIATHPAAGQKSRPTFSRVSTPSTAKIAAAMPCTKRIDTLRAILSPTNTAGTSAINMPQVVPATTATRSS